MIAIMAQKRCLYITRAVHRANLVLPLAGHDFSVDARDRDVREHAGAVVRLSDAAAVGVLEADRAVVGSLGSRLAVLRPSVGGHLQPRMRRAREGGGGGCSP